MLARLSFLLTTVALALAVTLLGGTARAAATVPDPSATPPRRSARTSGSIARRRSSTSWRRTRASESSTSKVTSTSPLKFTGVTVKNTGPYARTGNWSYGTETDGTNTINAQHGRLIALDPYTVGGQRRFAYVWVRTS